MHEITVHELFSLDKKINDSDLVELWQTKYYILQRSRLYNN